MIERITADQLSRLAVVYVRQSSPGQVQNNRESTQRQYALAQRAREFGWPEDRIETIDGDLGMTGSVAGLRRGFDQLCRKIALGEVGAVFGIEVGRLARNTLEWFQLLDLCHQGDTVIVEDSHVYAPGRNDDDLVLGLLCWTRNNRPYVVQFVMSGSMRKSLSAPDLSRNCPT